MNMYKDLARDLNLQFDVMLKLDLKEQPNFKVTEIIVTGLLSCGFEPADAANIVSRMTIDVSQDAWDAAESEIRELAQNMVSLIVKLDTTLINTYGAEFADVAIIEMAKSFELKFG